MAGFKGKFESVRQDWETPIELFDTINSEFNFTLDGAASETNKKCENYFSKDTDSMKVSWGSNVVWLNPPYGEKGGYSIKSWVEKSYKESLSGATVVMLIPARTNTNWFHDICLSHAEVRFIKGRPKFGGADHGLPQPLCYVIFKPPSKLIINMTEDAKKRALEAVQRLANVPMELSLKQWGEICRDLLAGINAPQPPEVEG